MADFVEALALEDRRVAAGLADDIRDLAEVTGTSYADWLGASGRGDFVQRRVSRAGGSAA